MKSPYEYGHLIVAAIRVLTHQEGKPPTTGELCDCLSVSAEQGERMCAKLHDAGIIELSSGAYGTRLFIREHVKLEDLPREAEGGGLAAEVEKFQSTRKGMSQKVAAFKIQKEKEQKALFAELEARLKKGDGKGEKAP